MQTLYHGIVEYPEIRAQHGKGSGRAEIREELCDGCANEITAIFSSPTP